MKKLISVGALFALVSVGAFAQIAMSAGGGLFFDGSFNNGYEWTEPDNSGGGSGGNAQSILSFGGYGFFDATYAEASVSFAYGSHSGTWDWNYPNADWGGNATGGSGTWEGSSLQLGFTLLGKYPIDLGVVTIFPLLGINYTMILSYSDEDGNKSDNPGDGSQFGILGGVGADYNLTDALYLRGQVLFQARFASQSTKDSADNEVKQYPGKSTDTTLGLGPVIRFAVGYRL